MSDLVNVKLNGYEKYSVNKNGEIYRNGKIRKTNVDRNGFEVISLFSKNKQNSFRVEVIVACSFFDSYVHGKTYVKHKDGNKRNNNLENLILSKEPYPNKFKHIKGKKVTVEKDGNTFVFESITEASKFTGIDRGRFSLISNPLEKEINGYKISF